MTDTDSADSPFASAWLLGAIGLGAALLLVSVFYLTRDRIELQQQRQAIAVLHQVLPAQAYDNELARDHTDVHIPGLSGTSRIYRARLASEPVAAVYEVTAPDGYAGPIDLLVGVRADGSITGVRVTRHRETPGLGDPIEAERSDWIFQFDNHSLDSPPRPGWAASRRGGDFDTLSNATLTSQAVIIAVRRVLEDSDQRWEALFADPGGMADPEPEEAPKD